MTMRTFESAEKTFKRRVRQDSGHVPVLKQLEEDKRLYWSSYSFTLGCECGWRQTNYTGNLQPMYAGRNGDILTQEYRYFNGHVADLNDESRVTDTPILVAKIHKVRVVHEVWLFHRSHDHPIKDPWQGYEWIEYLKLSNRWKAQAGFRSLESALAGAAAYVEKQEGISTVEWMKNDSVGVEAPVATIVSAASKLVNDAKDLKNPVALGNHLKLVHEGVTQLNILKQLEGELEERLHAFMDLGL